MVLSSGVSNEISEIARNGSTPALHGGVAAEATTTKATQIDPPPKARTEPRCDPIEPHLPTLLLSCVLLALASLRPRLPARLSTNRPTSPPRRRS